MKHTIALLLALTCLALGRPARAADPDPWWGKDKALHFTVSIGLGSGGYAGSALWLDRRWQRAAAGAGFSLTLGAGKELYDLAGQGDASWRDFTWDIAGTAVGVGLAYLLDLAFFPARRAAPTPHERRSPSSGARPRGPNAELASRATLGKTRARAELPACDCSSNEWPSSPEQAAASAAPRRVSSPRTARASW